MSIQDDYKALHVKNYFYKDVNVSMLETVSELGYMGSYSNFVRKTLACNDKQSRLEVDYSRSSKDVEYASTSFYGDYHRVYSPITNPMYYPQKDINLFRMEFTDKYGEGGLLNEEDILFHEYPNLHAKYGSRLTMMADLKYQMERFNKLQLKDKGYVGGGFLYHDMAECVGYKEDDEGIILILKTYGKRTVMKLDETHDRRHIDVIACDFISKEDAEQMVGRMLALELIANPETMKCEITWIRRLLFTRKGPVDDSYKDSELFNPKDYDAEFGYLLCKEKMSGVIAHRLGTDRALDQVFII